VKPTHSNTASQLDCCCGTVSPQAVCPYDRTRCSLARCFRKYRPESAASAAPASCAAIDAGEDPVSSVPCVKPCSREHDTY
jgi:hypothetical protein